jgi:hypothetical protein
MVIRTVGLDLREVQKHRNSKLAEQTKTTKTNPTPTCGEDWPSISHTLTSNLGYRLGGSDDGKMLKAYNLYSAFRRNRTLFYDAVDYKSTASLAIFT